MGAKRGCSLGSARSYSGRATSDADVAAALHFESRRLVESSSQRWRQPTPPVLDVFDIGIGGMTCASCVGRVERALKKQGTVVDVSVNLATEMARITPSDAVQDAQAWQREMRRVIRDAGYEPTAQTLAETDDVDRFSLYWAGLFTSLHGMR